MVSVKTKSGLVDEIGTLVREVGDMFDSEEGDAERDSWPPVPEAPRAHGRTLPTLSMHLLEDLR